jgi:hypothetical protein
MPRETQEIDWTAVIARALAFLCLHRAKLQDETLVKQANFLERFGIPRSEAAVLLGSSEESLKVIYRRRKQRGGKSTAKKSSPRRK